MRILRSIILIFVLLSGFINASGRYTFAHYTADDGLSSSAVYKLFQDSEGYIWIATSEGLNRFDGKEFKVYKHSPFDSTSLSDNWVISVFEDNGKNLWVGTHNGGLNKFDPVTETFKHYKFDVNNNTSISSDRIWHINQTEENFLWVSTSAGLNRFSITDGKSERFVHNPDDITSLKSNSVNITFEDSEKNIWVGTFGGGLHKLFNVAGNIEFERVGEKRDDKFLSRLMVKNIAEDKYGYLWLATYRNGIVRINKDTYQYQQYKPADYDGALAQNSIFGLLLDSRGTLWIGTHDEGICIPVTISKKLVKNLKFRNVMADPLDQTSLGNDSVVDIIEDKSGQIWFATDNGLSKYSPDRAVFNHVKFSLDNPNSLSRSIVKSVIENSKGELVVGTYGGGVDIINNNGSIRRINSSEGSVPRLSNNTVWVVEEDKPSEYWIGTSYGLNYINLNTNSSQKFFRDSKQNSLSHNNISALYNQNERYLWVGTWGGGLNIYDKSKGLFFRLTNELGNPSSLSSNVIKKIIGDDKGNIWIGTFGGGVNLCSASEAGKDFHKIDFERFTYDYKDNHSISSDNITDIYQASNGVIWVGTHGAGLNKVLSKKNISTGKTEYLFEVITEAEGLPDNTIYRILEDNSKHLWLSTNKGLVKFDPERNTSLVYDKTDGLQDNEFDQAACKKKNNDLVFGGVNGLNYFNPESIKFNNKAPEVVITGFTKFDADLNREIEVIPESEIDLAYNDYFFNVSFAALDFTKPEMNQYAYKLEGFDKDWIYCGNRSQASYTNITGGDYIFRVKASNNEGIWNETGASLNISVDSAPWFAWYAYLIYLAIAVGMVYLIIYVNNKESRIQLATRQKELNMEREISSKLRKEEKLKEVLYEISEAAAKARSLELLYEAVHEILKKVIFADNLYIAMYNSSNDTISFPYFIDEKEDLSSDLLKPRKPGKGLTEYVIKNGKALFVDVKKFNELVTAGEVTRLGEPSVEWIGVPLKNSKGKIFGILAVQNYFLPYRYKEEDEKFLSFVSNQIGMAIERKLEEDQKSKSDFIVNSSKAHMSLINKYYEYEAVNQTFCNTHSLDREIIIGKKVADIWGDGKFTNVIRNYLDRAFEGREVTYQAWFETQSHGLGCYDVNYYPYINEEKEVTHVVVVSRDITELVRAEENIKKLLRAVEQIEEVIFMTTLEGKITYINPAFEKVYGYSLDEAIGQNPSIIKSDNTDGKLYKSMWETILDGRTFRSDITNKSRDGELIEMELSINPVLDNTGGITGYIAVQTNIMERKRAEKELRKAKELAEKSDKLKTEFLSQMSHEIRTPLNMIMNTTQILEEELHDSLSDDMQALLKGLSVESRRIIRTVHLIVDMSELQAGSYEYKPERVNVKEIIDKLETQYREITDEKKLKFIVENQVPDAEIHLDKYSFNQILMNLTDNAVKYTEKGSVVITLKNEENNQLDIVVTDTGVGIDEDYLPHIFDPFSREEDGFTRRFEGTGLGMALIKRYCDMNNISLDIHTLKESGSRFTLRVPLVKSEDF